MESLEEMIYRVQQILLSQYEEQNIKATNTQLFSFLALLNAYIPDAYLLMSECQQILGPPDPIHGGPPFIKRMEPFSNFIKTSGPSPDHKCTIEPMVAQCAVKQLASLGISRSATVKKFIVILCGDQLQSHILQFIKDLLTKRKSGKKGREKFSRLIEDIRKMESFNDAVSVLKMASDKLRRNPIFPQTLSRLYYMRPGINNYNKAEEWAKEAIARAPNNSYVADTLGQIYKNRLLREDGLQNDILHMAVEAFKDVERKADKEEGPEMMDTASVVSISKSFNNRGLFGFIQVAKIAFEKLKKVQLNSSQEHRFIQENKMGVEAKFDFFEWYLTYSKPVFQSSEPSYFWKDIVCCYELYTTKKAAESTSFPGLLDVLNRDLFTSKGKRALLMEAEATVSDLEAIQDDLKTAYEANVDDDKAAERYILSNIILSNKMHNSPKLTPVKELQAIIHRFLDTKVGQRSLEFYLLVLLLFWSEEQPLVVQEEDDEEDKQQVTEDDGSEDITCEDEESDEDQERRGEPAQLSRDIMFDPDLQQYVTFMGKAFEREYAKYLRGRYHLPLFFLGKGSGLGKWIHKSKLDAIVDAIVEEKMDAELAAKQGGRNKKKWSLINQMWIKGDVWRVPEIQDILLPVEVELCQSPTMPQENEEVFVCVGGKKIMATTEDEPFDASVLNPMLFYLGFTIQGPLVFKVGHPDMSRQ